MKDIPISKRVIVMRQKSRKRKIVISVLVLVLSISFLGLLAYFSFHPKVTVDRVVVVGNRIIDKKEIEDSVLETIKGKYLYIFSKSNFLLIPQKKVYNKLLSDFPRIEKLSVEKQDSKTLIVDLSERTGVYLYCGVKVPEISKDIGSNCYYVNKDGFIFDKAPYFSGSIYFKFYKDLKNDSVLGLQVLEKEDFKKMTSFIDGLIDLSFKPNYIIMDSNDQYELYLNHKPLMTNPKILIKSDSDLSVLFGNIESSMKKDEFKNEINSKYDKLLYIDLRFKNKVLYKFNDE